MIRAPSPVVALALSAVCAACAAAAPLATLDTAHLHAGQKAVVRTVFQGDSVEVFDAEILGVVAGGRSDGDMILARATSERVIRTGVAQGMSGSPVYVDGKLVGALSSGWSFSREPLFGVTPIGEMLAVLDMPASSADPASAGPSGVDLPGTGGSAPRFRELRWSDASEAPAVPSAPPVRPGPEALPLPLACAGLNPAAGAVVSSWLAPLGLTVMPGGRAPAGGPGAEAIVPGAAVAVDIMRGDLQMSAIGTVTWRDGDRVLLFGHPFFQSGEIRLPMSTAEITTIVPSAASSFKIGVRGREVGIVTQDRRAAVAGRLGGVVRLMPLAVTIAGAGGSRIPFRFEAVEDRALAPSLIGIAALNSLLESGGSGANQTLRWSLTLHRHGAGTLTLGDIVSGDNPATDVVAAIAAPLRFLFNNPFERLTLDSVAVRLDVAPAREQWTLRNARILGAAVRPGGTVHVECELERWRGGRSVVPMDLTVPEEVPDGNYVLWVGGGAELSRYEAKDLPARYRPTSLPDAWRRLAASRPSDGLYGALFARAPEVTSDGRDYPELPLSALALLSSGERTGDASRRGGLAMLDERRRPLGAPTRGELLLQVRVDAQAP